MALGLPTFVKAQPSVTKVTQQASYYPRVVTMVHNQGLLFVAN